MNRLAVEGVIHFCRAYAEFAEYYACLKKANTNKLYIFYVNICRQRYSQGLWRTSLAAQTVKHLSTTQETQVPSLGREDPLEEELATHTNILAWKISWTKKPGGLQSMGSQSQTRLSY